MTFKIINLKQINKKNNKFYLTGDKFMHEIIQKFR